MTHHLPQTQNKQPVCFSAAAEGFVHTVNLFLSTSTGCLSISSSLAARRTTTTWIQSRDVCSGQSALIINWLIILTKAQNVVKYNCLSARACLTFLPSSQWVFSSEQRRDVKAASPVYVVTDEYKPIWSVCRVNRAVVPQLHPVWAERAETQINLQGKLVVLNTSQLSRVTA